MNGNKMKDDNLPSGKSPRRLVIGVDIGMTFTGVAHCTDVDQKATVLQEGWPGAVDIRRKVPTILVYNHDSDRKSIAKHGTSKPVTRKSGPKKGELSSWGFLALDEDERYAPDKRTREFFKLCFDQDFIDEGRANGHESPFTHQEVCMFYKDYLTQLYKHLRSHYSSTRPDHWKSNVHFVFSVPTTWKNQRTINDLRQIAREAGFGTESKHTLEISLTEAHAAAVATAHELGHYFEKDQIILVCDAGGGTTDIALLRVANSPGSALKLVCLDTVRGEAAGSTQIDRDFRSLVAEKLQQINQDCVGQNLNPPIEDVNKAAELMSADRTFMMHKESLCPEDVDLNVKFRIQVPNASSFPNEALARELGFEGKKLCMYPKTLASLFDKRIDLICRTLNTQFDRIATRSDLRDVTVDYLILSGGLGSSKYVFERLEKRYAHLQDRQNLQQDGESEDRYLDCIPDLTIMRAQEPQLVVCKGLVVDKITQLVGNNRPIDTWIARQSYGLVGVRKYVKFSDNESDIITDDEVLDKTGDKWVEQIHWIVHKNQRLRVSDKLNFKSMRRFESHEDATDGDWTSKVVVSDLETKPDQRPQKLSQSGWKPLCVLKSNLNNLRAEDLTVQKGSMIPGSKKKKHFKVFYETRVKVGVAGVEFELWHNGEKKSRLGDVQIDWGRDRLSEELAPTRFSQFFRKTSSI